MSVSVSTYMGNKGYTEWTLNTLQVKIYVIKEIT